MVYINVDTSPSHPVVDVPITDRFVGGDGTAITFDRVISDSGGHWGGTAHPDVVCRAPLGGTGLIAKGVLKLRLEDFSSGTEFQIWQVEYDTSTWEIVETDWSEEEYAPTEHDALPRTDPAHDPSVKHYRFPVFSYVNPGHALGFRITQFHDSTAGFRIGVVARANACLEITPK